MAELLEGYQPSVINDQVELSQKSKEFIKITILHEELERERERLFQELSPIEKTEAFEAISRQFNIPEYITVKEAAEVLGVSPQMIRRHCADGKIIGHQTLEGSGKWRIESTQFIGKPNWTKFVEKQKRLKIQSAKIAETAIEYLDDAE